MNPFYLVQDIPDYLDYELSTELGNSSSINVRVSHIRDIDRCSIYVGHEECGHHTELVSGNISKALFTKLTGHRFPVAPELVDELVAALEEIAADNLDDISDRDELIRCAGIARAVLAKLEGGQP
jgi:hypothetical protein